MTGMVDLRNVAVTLLERDLRSRVRLDVGGGEDGSCVAEEKWEEGDDADFIEGEGWL